MLLRLDKITNLVYDKLLNTEPTSAVTSSDDDEDLEAAENYDTFETELPPVTKQPASVLRRKSTRKKKSGQGGLCSS